MIAALSKGGDWQKIVGVIGAMEEAQIEANAFSWSAAISAMERAGEWEKALGLFYSLRDAGGATDPAVYHAAISAAGSGAAPTPIL